MFIFLFLFLTFPLFSQHRVLSLQDSTGIASVWVRTSSGNSAFSDEQGFFEIPFEKEDTLYFRRIGYKEVFVKGEEVLRKKVVFMEEYLAEEVLIEEEFLNRFEWEGKLKKFDMVYGFNTNIMVCAYVPNTQNRTGMVKKLKIKFLNSFPVQRYYSDKTGKIKFTNSMDKKSVEDSCYFIINFCADTSDVIKNKLLAEDIIVPVKYLNGRNYVMDISNYGISFPKTGLGVLIAFRCFCSNTQEGFTFSLKGSTKERDGSFYVARKTLAKIPINGTLGVVLKVLY